MARNDNLAEDMLTPMSQEEIKKQEERDRKAAERKAEEIARWKKKFDLAVSLDSQKSVVFKTIVSHANQALSASLNYSLFRGHLWSDNVYIVLDLMVADERGNFQNLRYQYDPEEDTIVQQKNYKYLSANGVRIVQEAIKYIFEKISSYPDPIGELFFDIPESNFPYKSVKVVPNQKEEDTLDVYITAWPASAQDMYGFVDAAEKCGKNIAWPWP